MNLLKTILNTSFNFLDIYASVLSILKLIDFPTRMQKFDYNGKYVSLGYPKNGHFGRNLAFLVSLNIYISFLPDIRTFLKNH